nr:MAG TPA: protein of unknown function DUF4868 [Bacteriophage sp.]
MFIGLFVRGSSTYFRRILITGNREAQVAQSFEAYRHEFFYLGDDPLPEVEFSPYRTKETEAVAYVDSCPMVSDIVDNAKNWAGVQVWNLKLDLPSIKAVFMWSEKSSEVLIQKIEPRRVVLPHSGWLSSFGDGNTLEDMPQYAMHFDNQLTAVIRNGRLFFKSFFNASRIFDLSDYMQEATTETAKQFFSLSTIGVEGGSVESFVAGLSKMQLKRIPRVLAAGYVRTYTAEELARRAKATKCGVELVVQGGRLIMPKDRQKLDDLLLYLSDRIVSSYLDDVHDYETDSSRKLE